MPSTNSTPDDTPRQNGAATNGRATTGNGRIDIGAAFDDHEAIAAAFAKATEHVRQESRITGIPLVFWRDGRCVWETADGEEVPEPDWARRFRETGEKPPVLHRRVG